MKFGTNGWTSSRFHNFTTVVSSSLSRLLCIRSRSGRHHLFVLIYVTYWVRRLYGWTTMQNFCKLLAVKLLHVYATASDTFIWFALIYETTWDRHMYSGTSSWFHNLAVVVSSSLTIHVCPRNLSGRPHHCCTDLASSSLLCKLLFMWTQRIANFCSQLALYKLLLFSKICQESRLLR